MVLLLQTNMLVILHPWLSGHSHVGNSGVVALGRGGVREVLLCLRIAALAGRLLGGTLPMVQKTRHRPREWRARLYNDNNQFTRVPLTPHTE